jgi:hypothetical protein
MSVYTCATVTLSTDATSAGLSSGGGKPSIASSMLPSAPSAHPQPAVVG